ncbi:hypothetical protein K1Y77_02325 [Halomonas qaidamensis]|uniref:Uncharacterized protein n=1 Tax=Halomonas qaidamensis TaxID=2866211 RepID=A0ABY6JQM3_9GAMM|nr:hypothetical protein [Halomonas qaidamensis]UYV19536.1 hypothetical protein K1Y77_02325 [Halomonas qaidamensis]
MRCPVKGRWLAELSGTRCGGERVLPLLVFLDAAMLNQLDAGEPLTAVAVGLGWVGLGWVGLGWVGLGWVGLTFMRTMALGKGVRLKHDKSRRKEVTTSDLDTCTTQIALGSRYCLQCPESGNQRMPRHKRDGTAYSATTAAP